MNRNKSTNERHKTELVHKLGQAAQPFLDLVVDELIISIAEARKILGRKISDKMSDDEIEKLIVYLDEIARLTLKGMREGTLKIPEKGQTDGGPPP